MDFNEVHRRLGTIPHCDQRILHAPGECEYCDRHPDWQALRVLWGIAFTGHQAKDAELPCPAMKARPDLYHAWRGNVPRPAQLESREDLRQTETQLKKEGPASVQRHVCGESWKKGWWCTRDAGHDGPCALVPVGHKDIGSEAA